MNPQNLNRGSYASNIAARIGNAYEQFSQSDDYRKNRRNLVSIQYGVVFLSAVSTGLTNAYAHRKRIGDLAAFALAVLVVLFVERLYVVLQAGLSTCYKGGRQRLYASATYRIIQLTMIANGATLVAWIVGLPLPPMLEAWNHWSICVHFALALIALPAILDSDVVVENRMLELKAATARQDLVTMRKSAAIGSPLALIAAKTRGFFDAVALSFRLMFSRGGFSKRYMDELAQVEAEQYGHLSAVAPIQSGQVATVPRRPGFASTPPPTPPKAPAPWI